MNTFRNINNNIQNTTKLAKQFGEKILNMNKQMGGKRKMKRTSKHPLKSAERILKNYYLKKYSIGNRKSFRKSKKHKR